MVDGAVWSLGKCGDNGEVACYNTEVSIQEVEVQRLVADSAATTEHVEAETMTYNYEKLTNPGAITALTADPVTKEVTTRVVTSPGEMAWVLNGCATIGNKDVQQALNALGYDAGPIDGIVGTKTKAAIVAYRADKGLGTSTEIDDELMVALGLK